jgi:hypothetical protein
VSDGASGVAEPPVENRPFEVPDSEQKGYIEVSTSIPAKSDVPLVSPSPLTDPVVAPTSTGAPETESS